VHFESIARVLAGFAAFFTLAQCVPLAIALGETLPEGSPHSPLSGFVASMVTGLLVSALLWFGGKDKSTPVFRKESVAIAGLAWLLAAVMGALPFQWSGVLPLWSDAIFECVSGLTTCGGTVLGTANNPTPENTPASILLWRALLQWLGGLGVVLLFGLLLGSGGSNRRLLTVESVAITTDRDQPRASSQARAVMWCYLSLTAACAVCLVATGLSWFDAICHSFATVATGGYSTKSSIAVFDNVPAEVVLSTFMFIGGCSFAALAATARSGLLSGDSFLRSAEFRVYAAFTFAAVALVTANLMAEGLDLLFALRISSFNVISVISCCGFATSDFQAWPPLSITILLVSLLVGGCSGSAAGGFKQIRLVVCLKLIGYTVRQYVRPRSVERIKLDGEPLPAAAISSILAVVLLWIFCVFAFAAAYATDDRIGFLGALSSSASMQANAGPAIAPIDPSSADAALRSVGVAAKTLGPNIGPLCGFGDLSSWMKLLMSFQMVLGRLELLTLIALLMPRFWRS
jgi:trk system potassium uptake protein TrkH